MPRKKKATYVITDRIRTHKSKEDKDVPLGITEDPDQALRRARKATHDGRIEMREPDGTVRHFGPKEYTAVERNRSGHRKDDKGSDMYHGFIEYVESAGYRGEKPRTTKKRTPGRRTRIA